MGIRLIFLSLSGVDEGAKLLVVIGFCQQMKPSRK
jgi:hypothetical protein